MKEILVSDLHILKTFSEIESKQKCRHKYPTLSDIASKQISHYQKMQTHVSNRRLQPSLNIKIEMKMEDCYVQSSNCWWQNPFQEKGSDFSLNVMSVILKGD